jgi:hypothetical protein
MAIQWSRVGKIRERLAESGRKHILFYQSLFIWQKQKQRNENLNPFLFRELAKIY